MKTEWEQAGKLISDFSVISLFQVFNDINNN